MKRIPALIAITAVTAVAVASPAGAARPSNFSCSYSGNTTITWHSDKLNKLAISEVTVTWLNGGSPGNIDIVYDPARPGGHLSWPTPAGTVEVSYNVAGTINGSFDNTIFGGFTECAP